MLIFGLGLKNSATPNTDVELAMALAAIKDTSLKNCAPTSSLLRLAPALPMKDYYHPISADDGRHLRRGLELCLSS
jgi:hypothetical protein